MNKAAEAEATKLFAEIFKKYSASISALGGKVSGLEENEAGGYAEGDIGGEFDIIFWKGRYFGGANAAPNLEVARTRVQSLRGSIKP